MIALDFYDGAAGGLAQFSSSDADSGWFRFELLAWDQHQTTRIFCLSPVTSSQRLASLSETIEQRFWVPTDDAVGRELESIRRDTKRFVAVAVGTPYLDGDVRVQTLSMKQSADIRDDCFPNFDNTDFLRWLSFIDQSNSKCR